MVATVVAVFRVKVKPDEKLHMERSLLSASLMIHKLMHLYQCKELVRGRCVDLLSAPVGIIALSLRRIAQSFWRQNDWAFPRSFSNLTPAVLFFNSSIVSVIPACGIVYRVLTA